MIVSKENRGSQGQQTSKAIYKWYILPIGGLYHLPPFLGNQETPLKTYDTKNATFTAGFAVFFHIQQVVPFFRPKKLQQSPHTSRRRIGVSIGWSFGW